MMNWTDRHCRSFMRLISSEAVLYTEMITTGAILHGDAHYHLDLNSNESPVALQLGGSNHQELSKCVKLIENYTNLNNVLFLISFTISIIGTIVYLVILRKNLGDKFNIYKFIVGTRDQECYEKIIYYSD